MSDLRVKQRLKAFAAQLFFCWCLYNMGRLLWWWFFEGVSF